MDFHPSVSMLTAIRDRSHIIACRAKLRIDQLQNLKRIIAESHKAAHGVATIIQPLAWQDKYLKLRICARREEYSLGVTQCVV